MSTCPAPIRTLELEGVTKRFPGVLACDRVALKVTAGEVLALVGENGAGKTTLMNLVCGLHRPDAGRMLLDGREVRIASPAEAFGLGIGMVHQHFMLVPNLTVAENVALVMGRSGVRTDLDPVRSRLREISGRHGLAIEPDAVVWQLSVGEQQRVELAKALVLGASVLILDEPTAVLAPAEADALLALLRGLAGEGRAVVFVSHKLAEVRRVSDRIAVLRRGVLVHHGPTSALDDRELATRMAGGEPGKPVMRARTDLEGRAKVLELADVHCAGERGNKGLRGVSFDLREGEIFGIAGVSGNGQEELARAINGLWPVDRGSIRLEGHEIANRTPRAIMDRGMGYVPADRIDEGTIPEFAVWENLLLRVREAGLVSWPGFLRLGLILARARELVASHDIRARDVEVSCGCLSGGNIQKVILARELSREPRVLVAVTPTRGLDLGAAARVQEKLLAASLKGTAILLVSEELDELLSLCDRIGVIYEGRLVTIAPASAIGKQKLGAFMAGIRQEDRVGPGAS